MLTWVTAWVLTVSYVNLDNNIRAGAGYSYQLQYKDQKTCLVEAKKHRQRQVVREGFINTYTYVNRHKVARCDFQQIPLKGG